MDRSHWEHYLKVSQQVCSKYVSPKVLKTDGYNEIFDLPIERGIVPNLGVADVTLLEVEEVFIEKLKRILPEFKVVKGDIRSLTFPDNSFNVILDLSTIDHVSFDSLEEVFRGYARSLMRGGRLVVVAWMAENPMVTEATEQRGKMGGWTSLNQYFFPPEAFRKLLSQYFEIEREEKVTDPNVDSYLLSFTAKVIK